MKDLRNQLLVDNLNEKKNTGLIPMVNALTQYVIQPVSVNSYFAIGRYNVEGHILTYQLHIMLMRDVVDYNVSLTDETTGEFWADDKIIPQAMAEIRVEGEGEDARQIIRLKNGCMVGNAKELHWEGLLPNGRIFANHN